MKLNILKLQSGGDLFFSAVANPYSRSARADQAQIGTSSSGSSKDTGLLPDKLMEKLYENGIPNDIDNFMNMLATFEHRVDMGLGIDKSALYNLRAYANLIIKQSDYLDKAEKLAETNGALDEYAVDSRGNLFVTDNLGKIGKVHASLFDAKNLMALTVGELLQQRKFNPALVDNSDVVTAIGSNIGIEKINDYILNIINAVGSTDNSTEAYQDIASIVGKDLARRPSRELQAALLELYSWILKVGPDAIFKVKDLLKSKNMEAAMSYIMSMLPNNIRTQLIARNVAEGGEYKNSNKYAWDIISMAAMAGNDVKTAHGIDYEAGMNKAAGTAAGEKELTPQRLNMTPIEALVLGSLGRIDYNLISSKYPELSITLHGNGSGSLSDVDGNIVPKAPISIALQNSLLPVIDTNHITMGSEKISPAAFDTILYDGGPVINVWAPVDERGDIDLGKMVQFNEILDYIKKLPELTIDDKNKLLLQYGFNGRIDENNQFHGDGLSMAQFLVFTGLTTDEVLDKNTNAYVDVLSRDAKKLERELIERIYARINKGLKQGKYEFKEGFFGSDFIKAPVFMKLSPTAQIDVETFTGHGPVIRNKTYEEMNAYDLARYNRPLVITPSTNILNQYE